MVNSNQKNLREIEEVLSESVQRGITIEETCEELNVNPSIMTGALSKIAAAFKSGYINEKDKNNLMNLYAQAGQIAIRRNKAQKKDVPPRRLTKGSAGSSKNVRAEMSHKDSDSIILTKQEQEMLEYNAETDDDYEERSVGETIRGTDTFTDTYGHTKRKIVGYKYKIYIRDEKPLTGDFTREEMDKIYRLYSSMDGAGLTLRAVAREFHSLNFRDFKRILRAFNITKASIPVAPHIMEEYSEDELQALIMRNKENNLIKRIDGDRNKHYEKRYYDIQKEMVGLKSDSDRIEQIIESYFTKNRPKLPEINTKSQKEIKHPKDASDKPLYCIFGDIHYGKKFDNTIFGRGYNKDIAHERVMEIAKHTIEKAKALKTKEIVVVCLGDLLECALEDGMHPGHSQEMDLFQDEQVMFAIDSLTKMLNELVSKTDCKITYCCIHGNHDRIGIKRDDDKNRTAGKLVTNMVARLMASQKRLEVINPKNNLLRLKRGKICLIAQHGDAALNKKKPSELVNIYGEGTACYHLILKGHWHSLKADEGTNFLALTAPSVASADKYILEELGNNNLAGFILGHEPDCYGFNYEKITLY